MKFKAEIQISPIIAKEHGVDKFKFEGCNIVIEAEYDAEDIVLINDAIAKNAPRIANAFAEAFGLTGRDEFK